MGYYELSKYFSKKICVFTKTGERYIGTLASVNYEKKTANLLQVKIRNKDGEIGESNYKNLVTIKLDQIDRVHCEVVQFPIQSMINNGEIKEEPTKKKIIPDCIFHLRSGLKTRLNQNSEDFEESEPEPNNNIR